MSESQYEVGDVCQISQVDPGREGWLGAFVLATEIKSWGIQGFVHHINKHDTSSRVYIRLRWAEIDYIGKAVMVPQDEAVTEDK